MTFESLPASSLYKAISELSTSRIIDNPSSLTSLIKSYEDKLSHPLFYKKPNPQDEKKLKERDFTYKDAKVTESNFSDKDYSIVAQISKSLNLNEILAYELDQVSRKFANRYGGRREAASVYFHEENSLILSALYALLWERKPGTITGKMAAFVSNFTNNLIYKRGLIENLCELVSAHTNIIFGNPHGVGEYIIQRRLACEILFLIADIVEVKSKDAFKIMSTLTSIVGSVKSVETDTHIFAVATILTGTMLKIMDPARDVDTESGRAINHTPDAEFLETMEKDVNHAFDSKSNFSGFEVILAFQFASSVATVSTRTTIQNAESIVRQTMSRVISSLCKFTDNLEKNALKAAGPSQLWYATLHKVVDDAVSNEQLFKIIETRFHEDEKRVNQNQGGYSLINVQFGDAKIFLNDILDFLGQVYKNSEYALKFFDKDTEQEKMAKLLKAIHTSVYQVDQHQETPKCVPRFMGFLASLVSDPISAERVYSFLTLSRYDFSYINGFLTEFVSFGQLENVMPPILLLIEKLVLANDSIAKSLTEILETVFSCITLPSPASRTQTFMTLAAFAHYDEYYPFLWKQIEISIDIHKETSSMFQTLLDERRQKDYPVTIGFLELLLKLFHHGSISQLGDGKRAPGLNPYLTYVQVVFRDALTQSYSNPGQKWKIVSLCLSIFQVILEDYIPVASDFENQVLRLGTQDIMCFKPPGWEVMRDLCEISSMRTIIGDILLFGHETLKEERTTRGGLDYEVSVSLCLQIMLYRLLNEQKFLQVSMEKPNHQNLIRFIKWDSKVILAVARYLAYEPNDQIRFLTAKILLEFGKSQDLLILFMENAGEMLNLKSNIILSLADNACPEEECPEGSSEAFQNETKNVLLDLLLLRNSFSFYLCGFTTKLQRQSVSTSDNCFTMIIDLLNQSNFYVDFPNISSKCVELVYRYCADPRLSTEVDDFLQKKEFLKNSIQEDLHSMPTVYLVQRAWIVKTLAFHIFSGSKPASKQLIDELFGNESSGELIPSQRTLITDYLDQIFICHKNCPMTESELLRIAKSENVHAKQFDISYIYQELKIKDREFLGKVVEMNAYIKSNNAMELCFDGWRQLVEVTLHSCADQLSRRVMLDITQSLFDIFITHDLNAKLSDSVSQVVLMLMAKLTGATQDQYHHLLAGISKCMMKNSLTWTTKMNLYSTLLYYLQKAPLYELEDRHILRIAEDAKNGNDLVKATAFAVLDNILTDEVRFLRLLNEKGHLNIYYDSLPFYGRELKDMLDSPNSKISLFIVYEAMMSFFAAISSRNTSNRSLLTKIDELEFINLSVNEENVLRYDQLMTPVYTLIAGCCVAKPEDVTIAGLVIRFIEKNPKAISRVLKTLSNNYNTRAVAYVLYVLEKHHRQELHSKVTHIQKYQKLMINILAKLRKPNNLEEIEICKCILQYFVVLIVRNTRGLVTIPFTPSMSALDDKSLYTLDALVSRHFSIALEQLSERKKLSEAYEQKPEDIARVDEVINACKAVIQSSLFIMLQHFKTFLESRSRYTTLGTDGPLSEKETKKFSDDIKNSQYPERLAKYQRDNKDLLQCDKIGSYLVHIQDVLH